MFEYHTFGRKNVTSFKIMYYAVVYNPRSKNAYLRGTWGENLL